MQSFRHLKVVFSFLACCTSNDFIIHCYFLFVNNYLINYRCFFTLSLKNNKIGNLKLSIARGSYVIVVDLPLWFSSFYLIYVFANTTDELN